MIGSYFFKSGRTILFVFILFSCSATQEEPEHSIQGFWKLSIMESRDPDTGAWSEWRNGMQGYLLYDGTGHLALHLSTKGYENSGLQFPNFTDTIPTEALKSLTNTYFYMASYRILDGGSVVEHTRLSHSNPKDWGKTVQRRVSWLGDTLMLSPVENPNLRLKWVKN